MTEALAERPVASVPPPSPEAPVFFMHIAKTAGSYLNALLEDALGPGRVATHIELSIGGHEQLRAALARGISVFSGHVMNGLWTDIAGPLAPRFRKITILREPISHLASHLLWLDHYNRPDLRAQYAALDEAHRRVVDRIGATDLGDLGSLDAFLTGLNATETRLFDNCQARYLLMSGRRDIETMRPLSLADARAVRTALAGFDAVARQDRLQADLGQMSEVLGIDVSYRDRRVNEARSDRRIDIANPLVRQVLGKRTLLDQWLWRLVQDAPGGEQAHD